MIIKYPISPISIELCCSLRFKKSCNSQCIIISKRIINFHVELFSKHMKNILVTFNIINYFLKLNEPLLYIFICKATYKFHLEHVSVSPLF